MGDDNNSSDNEKKERRKLEVETARDFMRMMQKRANELSEEFAGDTDSFSLEPNERSVLLKINNAGLLEGVTAGLVSFIGLRRLRQHLLRRSFERAARGSGGAGGGAQSSSSSSQPNPFANHFDNLTPMQRMIQQQQQPQQFQNNNPFHKAPQNNAASGGGASFGGAGTAGAGGTFSEPFFFRISGLFLDMAFSTFIGWYVMMSFMDMGKIADDLAQLPLSPGRSTVSRVFCPTAVQWLVELQQQSANDPLLERVLQQPNNPVLAGFQKFSQHCHLRMQYEEKLRQEKGIKDPSYIIEIPQPGVPLDMAELEQGLAQETLSSSSSSTTTTSSWDENNEPTFSSGDFLDSEADSDSNDSNTSASWADDLVEDREEQDRKRSDRRY